MLIAGGAQIGAVVHDGKMAAVGGSQYTPDVSMEVNGPLKIRNNTAFKQHFKLVISFFDVTNRL